MSIHMIRSAFLAACIVIASGASALAQSAKETECRKFGQIATNIMAERKNGTNARQAERRILRAMPDASQNDRALAVNLVVWIYDLPTEQLTPEVSNTLYRTCLSQ